MKIVITESQFKNIKKLTSGLVILDESHDKYKDMLLSDEQVDEIISQYKGKPYIQFRKEQPRIYRRFKQRGPCIDKNGNNVGCTSKKSVKNTNYYLGLISKDMTRNATPYSDEELESAAKKYQNVSDFRENDRVKEQQARRRGEEFWDRVTAHMTPKGSYGKKMVYVYEFTGKDENGNKIPVAAYVGLTADEERRHSEHITGLNYFGREKDSAVTKFLKANPGTTFELKQLTDGYVPYEEAQELENKYENEYRDNGWLVLNVAKPGSLGATFRISDEEIKNQIDSYDNYSDYYKNYNLVNRVRRRGLQHLTKNLKRDREYLSDDEVIDRALKYDSYRDFYNKTKPTVWQQAYKRGLLDIIKEKFKEKEENIDL
jgi:hypothetical protein